MNSQNNSLTKHNLFEIIKTLSINRVKVGGSLLSLYEILGVPQLPACRIWKKSPILIHEYDNINILSEHGNIILLRFSFHDPGYNRVDLRINLLS